MQIYSIINLLDEAAYVATGGGVGSAGPSGMTTQESLFVWANAASPVIQDAYTLYSEELPDLSSATYDKRWKVPLWLVDWDTATGGSLKRFFGWESVHEPDPRRPKQRYNRVYVIKTDAGKVRWQFIRNRLPPRRLISQAEKIASDMPPGQKAFEVITGGGTRGIPTEEEAFRRATLEAQKKIQSE